jgi:flagellar biosynthesis GTPase FlhF
MSPVCKSGQIHEGAETSPIMTCNACGFRSCVLHQIPFHEGETCTQYDNRMIELQNDRQAEQLTQLHASENGTTRQRKRKRNDTTSEVTEAEEQRLAEERRLADERRTKEEQQRRAKEKLSEEMASTEALKRYIRCPGKDCGYVVHKISGCDHMTCEVSSTRHTFVH